MEGSKVGIVLAGHGAPATDSPPEWVGELMALQWAGGEDDRSARAEELDAKIRSWPRRPGNDPYKEGLERVAEALRPLLPGGLLEIGYNEFCRPSVPEAIRLLIRRGVSRILVVPSMLTPGGLHSEEDIPRAIERVARENPGITIDYVWPFDVKAVAELLAAAVQQRAKRIS